MRSRAAGKVHGGVLTTVSLPQDRPTRIRYAVFGLACGTSWLLYLHRYTFALLKPELAREWNLDKVQLGLLDSAFTLTSTVFQFPLGILADLIGVRLVLTALIVVWCLGLGWHALAATPAQLWWARALFGAGQSAVYSALSRTARMWFPNSVRTTLQGIAGITCGRLGGMCSYVLFATVLLGWLGLDWRYAVNVFAASGLVFAVLFVVVFRNSPGEHPWVNEAERELIQRSEAGSQGSGSGLRFCQVLGRMKPRSVVNLLALCVQMVLSTVADSIYSSWIPLFLAEVHGLKFEAMGIYSALPLLGGAIAGTVGGLLNDAMIAWTGNRRWSRSGIAILGKGIAGVILLAALLWYESPYVFCWLLFAVKFFGDWSLATSWGVVTDIGGKATASVFAFNNAVAQLCLMVASPLLGLIARDWGWPAVFVAVAGMYFLCALTWLVIDCRLAVVEEAQPPGPRL